MIELATIRVGDPSPLWADLGFVVEDGGVWLSGVRIELDGEEAGIRGWGLRGLPDGVEEIDGLRVDMEGPPAQPTPDHPNAIEAIDHVVFTTPDVMRSIEAIEAAGMELRRTREAGTRERPSMQAFFKMGEPILELVGPPMPRGDGPMRMMGLAFTSRDLEATASYLGARLRPIKDAVQPGRRIGTLDRGVGSTVPFAVLSRDPKDER